MPIRQDPPLPDAVARELMEAGNAYIDAERALEAARRRRDAAIVLLSDFGVSRRKVGDMAGVTVGRVQQIVDANSGPEIALTNRNMRRPVNAPKETIRLPRL
jgi:hypothetical protein